MSVRVACICVLSLVASICLLNLAFADKELKGEGAPVCSSVTKTSVGKEKETVSVETLKCPAPTVEDNTPTDRKAN